MNVEVVFGFILAIIIAFFMLTIGGSQIQSVFCTSADAQTQKALIDLQTMVEDVYWNTGEGSSRFFDVRMPDPSKLCFINPDSPGAKIYDKYTWRNWNPNNVLMTLIEDNGYNLWFTQCSGEDGKTLKYIKVNRNFCVIGGHRLYLENLGTSVLIDSEED